MERMVEALRNLPLAAWVIVLAVVFFIGEYTLLRWRQSRSAVQARLAEQRLVRFATALRNYARDNLQRLPGALGELGLPEVDAVVYRPVPRLNQDEKLILIHDRRPDHKVLEFPVLRKGRALVFCSGRMQIVSEEVFEKLIAADAALRERLGIAASNDSSEEYATRGPG